MRLNKVRNLKWKVLLSRSIRQQNLITPNQQTIPVNRKKQTCPSFPLSCIRMPLKQKDRFQYKNQLEYELTTNWYSHWRIFEGRMRSLMPTNLWQWIFSFLFYQRPNRKCRKKRTKLLNTNRLLYLCLCQIFQVLWLKSECKSKKPLWLQR